MKGSLDTQLIRRALMFKIKLNNDVILTSKEKLVNFHGST